VSAVKFSRSSIPIGPEKAPIPLSVSSIVDFLVTILYTAQSVQRKGHWLDSRGSSPGRGNIFLIHSVQTVSGAHPVSYPTVPGFFARRYSGRGVKLTTHLHLLPRSRIMKLYLHAPILFHGIVLNHLNTGINLLLYIEREILLPFTCKPWRYRENIWTKRRQHRHIHTIKQPKSGIFINRYLPTYHAYASTHLIRSCKPINFKMTHCH
jgi:hypothetical protein